MKRTKLLALVLSLLITVCAIPFNAMALSSVAATVTAPVDGADPDTAPVALGANYTIVGVDWYKGGTVDAPTDPMLPEDKFEAGKTYIVVIGFIEAPGYVFAHPISGEINGINATLIPAAPLLSFAVSFTVPALITDRDITVVNGTASIPGLLGNADKATAGTPVTVTADDIAGKVFTHWTVDSGSAVLADENSAVTTFTMPDEDVVITAHYKDKVYPTVTVEIPFTKVVTLGGNTAPGKQTFELEIFEIGNSNANEYKDVTYTASIETDGKNEYVGKIVITGPENQMENFLCEGFYIREKNGGAENWTYSEAAYLVLPIIDLSKGKITDILYYPLNKTADGYESDATAVDALTFENTYTVVTYHTITVINGTASIPGLIGNADTATAGTPVTVTADDIAGKVFTHWTVDGGSAVLADENSAVTTFTMPDEDVVITAHYKDKVYPTVTVEIPFTKVVTLGGNTAPGKQTFELEIFEIGNSNANEYKDVTYTANIETDGKNEYVGKIVITGPENQMENFLCEGFYIREKNGGAENWTYSEAAYLVLPIIDLSKGKITDILYYPLNKTADGYESDATAVDALTFENTYTFNKEIPAPTTGDNSRIILWAVLLLVSGYGAVTAYAVSKKKK